MLVGGFSRINTVWGANKIADRDRPLSGSLADAWIRGGRQPLVNELTADLILARGTLPVTEQIRS